MMDKQELVRLMDQLEKTELEKEEKRNRIRSILAAYGMTPDQFVAEVIRIFGNEYAVLCGYSELLDS